MLLLRPTYQPLLSDRTTPMTEKRFIGLVTAAALATLFCLLRVESRTAGLESPPRGQQKAVSDEKTVEQVYKNIQVLNGLPASELDGVMDFMSASLGVGCTHCHTNPWDSDSKSTKVGARRMILMTRAINKENFSGNPAVTCYTCHRGRHNTEPLPTADLATTPAPDVTATTTKTAALPSAEDVIARYIRAIGGDAAIGNLKTRTSRGTETTINRMTPPQTLSVEILQAAPDKSLIARNDPRGATLEGFDGSKGWTKDARGKREASGRELADMKRRADFFRYLKVRESYPQMRVLAKEKVRDKEAYVVGATSRDDSREKLYFDVETGLLVRQFVAFKTAFGSIPEVTDFDDYREVSGVKLPFTVTWSRPPFSSTLHFAEIRLNAIIDESRFDLPAR